MTVDELTAMLVRVERRRYRCDDYTPGHTAPTTEFMQHLEHLTGVFAQAAAWIFFEREQQKVFEERKGLLAMSECGGMSVSCEELRDIFDAAAHELAFRQDLS